MGKFDGYLICSDLDGTFRGGGDTEAVNGEAIKYFTKHGGKFAFTTGRAGSHLYEHNLHTLINAPGVLFNGAVVYDFENECIISEKRLTFTVDAFLKAIAHRPEAQGAIRLYLDCTADGEKVATFQEANEKFFDMKDVLALKIVCAFSTPEDADCFKAFVLEHPFFKETYISKSWSLGVEFNCMDGNKGKSAGFIKNYLGDIHTLVGVGDYENDISLIEQADVGIAVGNAIDELKRVADMVICPASEYAIKALVEKIENGSLKK